MPNLPVSTDFTGSSITEAQFKTALTNLREYLATLFGADGTLSVAQDKLKVPFAQGLRALSGAYTVVVADRGEVFGLGGATVTLPSAATAGRGFCVAFHAFTNGGTIEGNGAKIDGASSITLNAGESCILVCSGPSGDTEAEWWSVGRTVTVTVAYPISIAKGGTGATDRVTACNNLKAVKTDQGHGVVGSFVFAAIRSNTNINAGGTRAGSDLIPCSVMKEYTKLPDGSLSGTWRCLGKGDKPDTSNTRIFGTLWQRIS